MNVMNIQSTLISMLIIITVVLTGCNKKQQSTSTKNKVETEDVNPTSDENNMEKQKTSSDEITVPDIEGRYDLIEGFGNGPEKIHDYSIYKGILIINRISDTEFGFVKVTKTNPYSPIGEHGIFSYKENRFYKKEIDYPEKIIYHSKSMDLIVNDSLISTTRYTSNMTIYGIWRKSNPESNIYVSLRKTLEKEKKIYADFYNEVYYDSSVTGRNEFIKYKTGKRFTTSDSIFLSKWKKYNTNSSDKE